MPMYSKNTPEEIILDILNGFRKRLFIMFYINLVVPTVTKCSENFLLYMVNILFIY